MFVLTVGTLDVLDCVTMNSYRLVFLFTVGTSDVLDYVDTRNTTYRKEFVLTVGRLDVLDCIDTRNTTYRQVFVLTEENLVTDYQVLCYLVFPFRGTRFPGQCSW